MRKTICCPLFLWLSLVQYPGRVTSSKSFFDKEKGVFRLKVLYLLLLSLAFTDLATSAEVAEVNTDRQALEAIYIANAGERWRESAGWMTDRPLNEWHGIMVREGRVVGIDLSDNGLVGGIPEAISGLTALESLDLRWNVLDGNIPSSLGDVENLETILLSGNQLSGVIPWQLGTLSNLVRIDLSNNSLTGSIPNELGQLTNLRALGLHNNGLTGPIPWQLGNASRLQRLMLSGNKLTGWVPPEIGELQELTHFNLSMNEMSGSVTEFTRDARRLELLDLRGSGLAAPYPGEMAGLESVIRRAGGERVQRDISGTELLGETTELIQEASTREFIAEVMRAIRVQDGLLKVDEVDLPAGIDVAQVGRAAARINTKLDEAGQRIGTLNDLERALEVYGSAEIFVPFPAPGFSPRFEGNASDGNLVAVFGQGQIDSGSDSITGNVSAPSIVVQCTTLEVQHPHVSARQPGIIKAKFDGSCINHGTVPFQVITGTVNLELWRLHDLWFFWHAELVGSDTHERRSPPQPLRWNPNTADVSATCRGGYYFARATISWTGSLSGTIPWYFPPNTYLPSYSIGTNAHRVECR